MEHLNVLKAQMEALLVTLPKAMNELTANVTKNLTPQQAVDLNKKIAEMSKGVDLNNISEVIKQANGNTSN